MMSQMYIRQWKHNCSANHIDAETPAPGEENYISFWRKAFRGKKVDVYSYRLFHHYMGNVPHVIPEILGNSLLEEQLNPRCYRDFYSDKNVYSMYYGTRQDVWNNVDYSKNDFQIPCWQQVKDMAVSIAHHTPHMRLIAFDICLDSSSSPRVIEMNVGGFSWWLFLYTDQDVFAGDTQNVIDYCLEKNIKSRN